MSGKEFDMNQIYLANAFSLQMVKDLPCTICVAEVNADEIPATALSVIGHADTAAILGTMLMMKVPCNRANVTLEKGDELYVAQLMGGRLPEGATTLPEGFNFKFLKVTID